MKKYNYLLPIIILILLSINFLSAYPGGITSDTIWQYNESIKGDYSCWCPPLMAMLWSVLNKIHQGPELMLLLHLLLLWIGVSLLYYSDNTNKFKWLYLILPFSPNILGNSGMIWKDIGFSYGTFFIIATCIFYTYKIVEVQVNNKQLETHTDGAKINNAEDSTPFINKSSYFKTNQYGNKTMPFIVILWLLLICFYIINVKFQAKFIIPFLVFFIFSVSSNRTIYSKLFLSFIVSLLFISSNIIFNTYLSKDPHQEQRRQLFDLIGISVGINNDSVFPAHIKSGEYDFNHIKKQYNPQHVTLLDIISLQKKDQETDINKIKELNSAFFKAIVKHPISYLRHRYKVMDNMLSNIFYPEHYAFLAINPSATLDPAILESQGYSFLNIDTNVNPTAVTFRQRTFLYEKIKKYLSLFPNALSSNYISLFIITIYLFYCAYSYIYNKSFKNKELQILTHVTTICFAFTIANFFTIDCMDYRYYTLVRLVSMMTLPIFIKALFQHNKIL